MSTMVSQITSLTIVYSIIYSGADQRKHQSSSLLAFVRGIHRGPVNSPHNGRWCWKCLLMLCSALLWLSSVKFLPIKYHTLDYCSGHWGRDHFVNCSGHLGRDHFLYVPTAQAMRDGWRHIITSSLIGWAHTHNDPCWGDLTSLKHHLWWNHS